MRRDTAVHLGRMESEPRGTLLWRVESSARQACAPEHTSCPRCTWGPPTRLLRIAWLTLPWHRAAAVATVWTCPWSSAPGGSLVNCALEQTPAAPRPVGSALSLGGTHGIWAASALVTPGSRPSPPVPSARSRAELSGAAGSSPTCFCNGTAPSALLLAPPSLHQGGRTRVRLAPCPGDQQGRAGSLLLVPVAKLWGQAWLSPRQ